MPDRTHDLSQGVANRRWIMASDVARFVGDIPEHYDLGLGPVLFRVAAEDLARRVEAHNPAVVLEIAAGTGILSRQLRDRLPASVRITITDLNAPMLERAQTKFQPGEQVEFQTADAMVLPFRDNSFDVVACQFGMMFFPDKDRCNREVFRVLAPGGSYLFNTWGSHADNPYGRIAHETIASFFPDDPPQFYKVPFSCADAEPIRASLAAAGFTDIETDFIRRQAVIPDAHAFARGLVFGNPTIAEIRARGGVDPDRVVDAFVEALHREFGADPGLMPIKTLVFEARKPG
ncbi:methyltransferase domain-containing protein [Kaistia defluvii]|uniref:class I SAM-dependent methyltransferase n=1 Tax=Kaistia defluvii TaxID=410841 RepID=UPI00224CFDA7|nr:class I SAM-dependent methyltransferase [Kaistia defluvii]MCX5520013.1 methyltransferase domain-containing protein [Kaistia defluvii]